MATLLTLVNNVLPEIGLNTLSTIVGNTNQTARQALALANRHGRSMAKHDWRILVKRNVITTASSADSYSLPSDFDHFIHNTEWNESTKIKMAGPLEDELWQEELSGVVTVTVGDRFQIRADGNSNRMFVRPIPTSSENVTFFYSSNAWVQSAGGQRKSSFTADTDVLLLDDYVFELGLKTRLLQAQRREYQLEQAEYLIELAKLKARDGGMRSHAILGGNDDFNPRANVPETGLG